MNRTSLAGLATLGLTLACSPMAREGSSTEDLTKAGAACAFDGDSDGTARILGHYTLPATSVRRLNPWLTQGDLNEALANGAKTVEHPGIGSGLDYLGNCSFAMVTDRGPNGDRATNIK